MDRRGVLAALTPLLAGCFGGTAATRTRTPAGESTGTATPATDRAATDAPTEAATPTETPESGTATPSGAEDRAAELLGTTRERIGTAVEAYAGSGDVTDVRADADGFVAADVYAALVRANAAAGRAAALAATDEQASTAAQLDRVIAFLTRATAAQENVIEGHDALEGARSALAAGDADGAGTRRAEMATAAETAGRALSHLTSDASADDMAAVEALDADDYEAKRAQFDAATTVLQDAGGAVSTAASGAELLSVARTRGENGNGSAAADDAADAQDRFETAASTFESLAADLPSAAAAFEEPLAALADLASEKASEAADVRSRYG
ncbi:MAG: hypothetical protein ABEH40_00920 [Haloferacaceae archaeon]